MLLDRPIFPHFSVVDEIEFGGDCEEPFVEALQLAESVLVSKLTTVHLQEMTGGREGALDGLRVSADKAPAGQSEWGR